jgi:hypothetical protein
VVTARDDSDESFALRSWLGDAMRDRDLLEPFARIATALERADSLAARA